MPVIRCVSRLLAVAILLVCAFVSNALAQQTGSVLGQSLTFTASGTATMTFAVAPQAASAVTVLTLELGPEGNSSAGSADQPLPLLFTLSATINEQPATWQFGQSGGVDQHFPGKTVSLSPNVPGYQLTVSHTAVATQETWSLKIDGLPVPAVRGVAMIDPATAGTFTNLTPSASCAAPPGALGTLLKRTLTFTGTNAATATFSAGQQNPNSATTAWLEFGAEGSGTPAPVQLPGGATLNVTANFGGNTFSHSFTPTGENDVPFGSNLTASLIPPSSPASSLHTLNIVRGADTPAPDENWTVNIAGLPSNMRGAITLPTQAGSANNALFQSLAPIGACPAPHIDPAIAVTPSQITAGDSPVALTVTSSGGFDLTYLTTAHVSLSDMNGISNFAIREASPTSLLITLDIDKCAQRGQRAVVINAHNLTLSAPFTVVHAPGQDTIGVSNVSISSPGGITAENTVQITGSSCVDLSGVLASAIAITPADAAIKILTGMQKTGANTFQFTFSFDNCSVPAQRTVTVGELSAAFTPQVSPPSIRTSGNIIQGRPVNMDILATGCVNLSQVGLGQITMSPNTGISSEAIGSRSVSQLTLSFNLASDAPLGSRTLSVVTGNGPLSAPFVVSPFQTCPVLFQCCLYNPDFGCLRCLRRCPVRPCPDGLKCCEPIADGCRRCARVCPLPF